MVQVCRNIFLKILGLNKHRNEGIAAKFHSSGKLPSNKRGGDRRLNAFGARRAAIRDFIKKLKCIESHYCRSMTANRGYVSSDLNIRKM